MMGNAVFIGFAGPIFTLDCVEWPKNPLARPAKRVCFLCVQVSL